MSMWGTAGPVGLRSEGTSSRGGRRVSRYEWGSRKVRWMDSGEVARRTVKYEDKSRTKRKSEDVHCLYSCVTVARPIAFLVNHPIPWNASMSSADPEIPLFYSAVYR